MSGGNADGTAECLIGSLPLHNKRKAGISRNLLSRIKFLFSVNIPIVFIHFRYKNCTIKQSK